jgi:hypothetical protein
MGNVYDSNQFYTQDPGAYKGTYLGTAAGTTIISNNPTYISHMQVLQRAASGTLIWYDSSGTSANALGTYVMGTQTSTDVPPTIMLKHNTKNGLTVVNSAGVAVFVAYLP